MINLNQVMREKKSRGQYIKEQQSTYCLLNTSRLLTIVGIHLFKYFSDFIVDVMLFMRLNPWLKYVNKLPLLLECY